MVEAATNEKKLVEIQLGEALEKAKTSEIENNRLKTSHNHAKDKVFHTA